MAVKAIRPYWNLGTIAFLSDVGVILTGGMIFKDLDGIVYGMIINLLFAVVVDKVILGMNAGMVALIVTEPVLYAGVYDSKSNRRISV